MSGARSPRELAHVATGEGDSGEPGGSPLRCVAPSARRSGKQGRDVRYSDLPGFVEQSESFGETTVTIEPARIREACEVARDELNFRLLSDIVATDYLNWGSKGVSGYIATAS